MTLFSFRFPDPIPGIRGMRSEQARPEEIDRICSDRKLVQSLSALYPNDTDEKRRGDGVLARERDVPRRPRRRARGGR